MATRFLDTGEAFLSAAEKGFARVADVPVHIEHDGEFNLTPTVTSIVLAVTIIGLAIVAFAV